MTTSKGVPHHLVFFKKSACSPCELAFSNLQEVLTDYPEFHPYVSVLNKADHPALVASFSLNLYPTVLITDRRGTELSRKVGVRFLTKEWWESALQIIHRTQQA